MRVFVVVVFILSVILPRPHALNVGVQTTGTGVSLSRECSRKCESECSGCPGEKPCDGLDACCMNHHDSYVQSKQDDYLSQECSRNLLICMAKFKKTGGQTFKGNKCDTRDVISVVMEAALVASPER